MKDKSIDGPGTPLPWSAEFSDTPYTEIGEGWVVDAADGSVCTLDSPRDDREANARYIVWSANNAPALVEALQEAIDALEGKVSNLDDVICCSGHDCGCLGSSHRDLLVHNIHAVLSTALGEMNDA